ncbi:MAG TPA: methylthioribulose 1-phosphate dehydratase [Gammaproteobacteria bacterium]|nr:methylthioribulose 1-phosphate dehydratase [Pseudomonadota bacterium]HBF07446.1 methylthioribulose 1-phosphate dehydratase [Gammaproteobacteria bacterium]HCK92545.1 methylthioribulose 1-phosphate dehydratase [Gammaproteobacteria bacterium]|tara:strand:+ start:996 stop:1589 length:594 start_codon:yes stop_codon:yes gene_type:complete
MDTIENLTQLTNSYYLRGWTPATSSNFSIRNNRDVVQITRSGRHKGRLNPQDFMRLKHTGEAIDEGKPSAETGLHLMLYQYDTEIKAVLHTHSPKATVLSMIEKSDSIEFTDYEILKAFPGVAGHETTLSLPVYDNSQDIPALVKQIEPILPQLQIPGFLIRGHGIYTWGNSLADADRHLEALEYLLECEIIRRQIK